MRVLWAVASARLTSPGPSAGNGASRSIPSHLPATIDRVDSVVVASTSRLPRCRSSDIDVGAIADNIRSPKINWMTNPKIPVMIHGGDRKSRIPSAQIMTAPATQAIPVAPPTIAIRIISQRDGRERCHSRQSTGLRSSDGPGSQRVSRPTRPRAGSLRRSTVPRQATGRIRQTATIINPAESPSDTAKKRK